MNSLSILSDEELCFVIKHTLAKQNEYESRFISLLIDEMVRRRIEWESNDAVV